MIQREELLLGGLIILSAKIPHSPEIPFLALMDIAGEVKRLVIIAMMMMMMMNALTLPPPPLLLQAGAACFQNQTEESTPDSKRRPEAQQVSAAPI